MELIESNDNRNRKIEITERLYNFKNLVSFFSNVQKEGSSRSYRIDQTTMANQVERNINEATDNHVTNSSAETVCSHSSRQPSTKNVPMKPIMVSNHLKPEEEDYYPDKSIYDGSKNVIFYYVPEQKYEKCLKNGCLFTHPPVFYKKLYNLSKFTDPTDLETNKFHPVHNNRNRMFGFSNLKDYWNRK
jgi:hypothetical protein